MNTYDKMMAEMGEKAYNEWVAETRAKQAVLKRRGATCVSPPPFHDYNRISERKATVGDVDKSADQKVVTGLQKTDDKPRNSEGDDLNPPLTLTKIFADHNQRCMLLKKLLKKLKTDEEKVRLYKASGPHTIHKMLEIAGVTEEEVLEEWKSSPGLGGDRRPQSPPGKIRETRNFRNDRHAPYGLSRHDGSRSEERRVFGQSNSSNIPEQRRKDPREYFKKSAYTWKNVGSEGSKPEQKDQKDPREYFKKSKFIWKSLQ